MERVRGAARSPRPTKRQLRVTRAVTRWYLENYYGTTADTGLSAMFCDPARVGYFAADPAALAAGEGAALFRLLVTMTMFQRRSDAQIMRVLRGIDRADALELTDAARLLELAAQAGCEHLASTQAIKDGCDLAKDRETKLGVCGQRPGLSCHLKRHTVLLRRYGHFGKVPTSAALMVRDSGAADLAALKTSVWSSVDDPLERALALERALCKTWRVSEKIAAMFLSAVTDPDLSGALAPWREGVDSTRFVVVDSNVDLYLKAVGYRGAWTYSARRSFVQRLAQGVELDELRAGLSRYNPRLVQQALYMFMSLSNRRENDGDCSYEGVAACGACQPELSAICGRCALAPDPRRTAAAKDGRKRAL